MEKQSPAATFSRLQERLEWQLQGWRLVAIDEAHRHQPMQANPEAG